MELYKLICAGMVMVICKRQNLSTVNNKTYFVRFQVLTAASMKFRIDFWDVLLCKIIVDRCFRDDGCSTYLWNVGRQLFYTAVHPRRQFWKIYFVKSNKKVPWLMYIVIKDYDSIFTSLLLEHFQFFSITVYRISMSYVKLYALLSINCVILCQEFLKRVLKQYETFYVHVMSIQPMLDTWFSHFAALLK
jgi:hypothetical protein